MKPLAYLMRPDTIDGIIGQAHLVGPNGVIRRMIEKRRIPSMILYGSPGIGKTSLAHAMCSDLNIPYYAFNASADNKATLKSIIESCANTTAGVIIVDEIHRMNKDIQDYLLPSVERGDIILVGITTVNPYHSVNPAIRSRTIIYKLHDLNDNELNIAFNRTMEYLDKKTAFDTKARDYIIAMAGGEIRALINMIEAVSFSLEKDETATSKRVQQIIQKPAVGSDKNDDNYYDTLSGLHKSIRGSDADAAIHYLAKLLTTEDFEPLIRRLLCICYEDIGLANPAMGPKVIAACDAALRLGMPEARLPLACVVIDMALSPKSNTSLNAVDAALKDINAGKGGRLPAHLKNLYAFDEATPGYLYPHDYPGSWVNQHYLPESLRGRTYYMPKSSSKYEDALKERHEAIETAKKKTNPHGR